MAPRYRITLVPEERQELLGLTRTRKTSSNQFIYARALLLCDRGPDGPGLGRSHAPRRRCAASPVSASCGPPKFDGAFEARLVALACTPAPSGRSRWTVRLLAEKAVELGLAEAVSPMTVQRVLKKTNCSLTASSTGASHPSTTPGS